MTNLLSEITFCDECPYSGEPNGCNREEGICKAHESYFDLVEENTELRARLEKAEKALGLACWEMALLDICCQGCDNEENCRTMFLDGGYKLKTNECERYWLNKAQQRLAELQKEE